MRSARAMILLVAVALLGGCFLTTPKVAELKTNISKAGATAYTMGYDDGFDMWFDEAWHANPPAHLPEIESALNLKRTVLNYIFELAKIPATRPQMTSINLGDIVIPLPIVNEATREVGDQFTTRDLEDLLKVNGVESGKAQMVTQRIHNAIALENNFQGIAGIEQDVQLLMVFEYCTGYLKGMHRATPSAATMQKFVKK